MYCVTLPARRKRIAFFVYCGYAVLLQTGREGSNLLLLCAQMGRIWSHLLFSTENDLKRCWHHPPSFPPPPPHPLSVRHTTHSLFHSAKQQVTTILGALRQRGVAAMCRQRSITARFLYDSPILLLIRYRLRPSRSRSRKRSGECGEREREPVDTRGLSSGIKRESALVLCCARASRWGFAGSQTQSPSILREKPDAICLILIIMDFIILKVRFIIIFYLTNWRGSPFRARIC